MERDLECLSTRVSTTTPATSSDRWGCDPRERTNHKLLANRPQRSSFHWLGCRGCCWPPPQRLSQREKTWIIIIEAYCTSICFAPTISFSFSFLTCLPIWLEHSLLSFVVPLFPLTFPLSLTSPLCACANPSSYHYLRLWYVSPTAVVVLTIYCP